MSEEKNVTGAVAKEPSRFQMRLHNFLARHSVMVRPQVPGHPGAVVLHDCQPRSFLGLKFTTPSLVVTVNDEPTIMVQGYPGMAKYLEWILSHPGLSPSAIKAHNEALREGTASL